jgi:hypothetical protein
MVAVDNEDGGHLMVAAAFSGVHTKHGFGKLIRVQGGVIKKSHKSQARYCKSFILT